MLSLHIEKEFNKSILKETALIMLKADEPNKELDVLKHGSTLVPTCVGKMIGNPAVISYGVKRKPWPDWALSRFGWESKVPENFFLCFVTKTLSEELSDARKVQVF